MTWLVFTRVFFGPHHRLRKSNGPMMNPTGCWREKRVGCKILCLRKKKISFIFLSHCQMFVKIKVETFADVLDTNGIDFIS